MNLKDSTLFFDDLPTMPGKSDSSAIKHCLDFSQTLHTATGDSTYVIDFYERYFRYVSSGYLFLCGHTTEEAQMLGYNFYSRIVHPDDLKLLADIHHIVFRYFHASEFCPQDLAYVAFNFRICHKGDYLMICHKVIPAPMNNDPQMAICVVTESVRKKSGNLTAYYKNNPRIQQYSFDKCKWEEQPAIKLTSREKKILKLARQGKSKKAADIMCLTVQSVQNLKQRIYRKLDVNTLEQAVIFVKNQNLSLE